MEGQQCIERQAARDIARDNMEYMKGSSEERHTRSLFVCYLSGELL